MSFVDACRSSSSSTISYCGGFHVPVRPISSTSRSSPVLPTHGFTTCTASNPTTYQEKISILVTSDGLPPHHPVTCTSGGNQKWTSKSLFVQPLHVNAKPNCPFLQRSRKSTAYHPPTPLPPKQHDLSTSCSILCSSRSSRTIRPTHAKERQELRIQGLQPWKSN